MKEDILVSTSQKNCNHGSHKKYTERTFDILNGFELIAERCYNCHKIIELEIRSTSHMPTNPQT